MNGDSRGHTARDLATGVFALGLCLVAFEASAAVIVPAGPPWAITVSASDPISGGGSTVTASVSPSASLVQTLTATDGDSTSSVDIVMGQSGFSFDLSLTASGNPLGGGGSAGFSTLIRFSVDTPTLFVLDGAWSASGLAGNGATVLGIILDENVAVFSSDQQSNYIAGVPSAIDLEIDGVPGGNNVNTVSGLQNGTLLPGINYRLIFSGALSTNSTASDNTATSTTSISFTPVPEPGTLALLAFGVAALGIARRRHARRRPR